MVGFYENSVAVLGHMFGAGWVDRDRPVDRGRPIRAGRACSSGSARWSTGTATRTSSEFAAEAGDEFSPSNAFQTGQLAMCLDGEWRVAFIAARRRDLDYVTAPLPVDDRSGPSSTAPGYINGT